MVIVCGLSHDVLDLLAPSIEARFDCSLIRAKSFKKALKYAGETKSSVLIPAVQITEDLSNQVSDGVTLYRLHHSFLFTSYSKKTLINCNHIIDAVGIYYDARGSSELEQLIVAEKFNFAVLQRAAKGIELLRRYRLGEAEQQKGCKQASEAEQVLVIDQNADDITVEFGLANSDSFKLMLETALQENPLAEVLIYRSCGLGADDKGGFLSGAVKNDRCIVVETSSPWELFEQVEKVYVVTSQLGFDALISGIPVSCFGMPFYAGWGLTADYLQCERRDQSRTVEQLFAAFYLSYCSYFNPYTREPCEFEEIMTLLIDQQRMTHRYQGQWHGLGFSRWKQGFITDFFGSEASITYYRKPTQLDGSSSHSERCVIWSSKQDLKYALEDRRDIWFMEDGFLRSVGLGANLVKPLSLVIDSQGIYYDPSSPSDLENYLNYYDFSDDLLDRASNLVSSLVKLKLSKYNVGASDSVVIPDNQRVILVPGQVETDASIRCGTEEVRTNMGLLQTVRMACPDAFIIYKPHPDVLAGARLGSSEQQLGDEYYDLMVTDIAMPELLEQIDEVHTMTSLTGFEALLRGLPVSTYGLPFYAGWGLTRDLCHNERRQRRLTLEQLVAAVMILYPVYIDPESGDQINVETAVALINSSRDSKPKTTLHAWFRQRTRKPY